MRPEWDPPLPIQDGISHQCKGSPFKLRRSNGMYLVINGDTHKVEIDSHNPLVALQWVANQVRYL